MHSKRFKELCPEVSIPVLREERQTGQEVLQISALERLRERLLARLRNERLIPQSFVYEHHGHGLPPTEVGIVGEWGNWVVLHSLTPYSDENRKWATTINIPPGTHQFKFLVDGAWQLCENYAVVDDNLGTSGNNVVTADMTAADANERDALMCEAAMEALEEDRQVGEMLEQEHAQEQEAKEKDEAVCC